MMNNKQLAALCKQYGLPSTGRKDKIISMLMKCQSITTNQIQDILRKLEATSSNSSKTTPHHTHYKESFNSVDILDRYYYQIQNKRIENWKSKYIISLLDIACVNSYSIYSLYNPNKCSTFVEFCDLLCKSFFCGKT